MKAGHPLDLATALDDLVVHLVADLTAPGDGRRVLPRRASLGRTRHRPSAVAMRVSNSATEARAVVALGRAMAQTMTEDPAFVRLVQRIAEALVERGSLDGEDTQPNQRRGHRQMALRTARSLRPGGVAEAASRSAHLVPDDQMTARPVVIREGEVFGESMNVQAIQRLPLLSRGQPSWERDPIQQPRRGWRQAAVRIMITRACLDCARPTESATRSRCRECEREFNKTRGKARQIGKARVERRKRVLVGFGNRCSALLRTGQRCHIRAPLRVHHVDGDPSNDVSENLVPLCLPHHRELAGAPRRSIRPPGGATDRMREGGGSGRADAVDVTGRSEVDARAPAKVELG